MSGLDPSVSYLPIPGFPGYLVGDDGSVWSNIGHGRPKLKTWKPLKGTPSSSGHITVKLTRDRKQKTHWCHILILEAFVGPCPDGMECRHRNGIPADNRLENIEWNTRSVNTKDRKRHGNTNVFGEGHPNAIFSDEEVLSIRARAASGERLVAISKSIGKSLRAVRKAAHGVTYDHLPNAIPKKKAIAYTPREIVIYIRQQAEIGRRQSEIRRELGLPSYLVSRIVNRKTHADV